ncbi:hypothetical protein VTO73DRAFT_13796 [Trametes versicolor]
MEMEPMFAEDPNPASTGSSAHTGGSSSQSFTTAYSDGEDTVRGNRTRSREDIRSSQEDVNPGAGPRRPASNVSGTGTQSSPPSPTPMGGVHWDNMAFAASSDRRAQLGRYDTVEDITPPVPDPLQVRGHSAGQGLTGPQASQSGAPRSSSSSAPSGRYPRQSRTTRAVPRTAGVQHPLPRVPHSGPPQWDAPGMPPSISSDPNRGRTAEYEQYSEVPASADPTTGYAESLYGPAVDQGSDPMGPSGHSASTTGFPDPFAEQSMRVIRQQESLRQRLRQGTQVMEHQAQGVDVMAGRGQSVIQEFVAEVNAMRSRVNHIVGDNNKMLDEVERGFAATKSLLESAIPLSSSTPRLIPRSALLLESAPEVPESTHSPGQSYVPDYGYDSPAPQSDPAAADRLGYQPAPAHEGPWQHQRDTPPHMSRTGPRSAQSRSGPPQDTTQVPGSDPGAPGPPSHGEAPLGYGHIHPHEQQPPRMNPMGFDRVPLSSEHVRFARDDRGGSQGYTAGSSQPSGRPPVIPAAPLSSKPKAFRLPQNAPSSRVFSSYPPVTHNYTDRDPIVPLSVVGRPNPGATEVVGHLVDSDGHREVMLVHLCDNIRYKTGWVSPPLPPGMKYPKIDPPAKYDGADDHNVFYNWLDGYLTWLRAYNVCGPETDRYRVFYLRTYLTGKAVDWFTVCIDNPSLGYQPTFEETICAMHRRFVHSSSAAKATLEFEKCRYRIQDGIESFYAELMLHASRMVEPPDNYTIRRRLVDGLPVDMFRILTLDRNISAEEASAEEILTSIRQVEQGLTRLRHRESRDRDRRPPPPTSGAVASSRPEPRGRERSRSRDRDRSNTPRPAPATSAEYKPVAARVPTPGQSRPVPAGNTCFSCGQLGHYANDPTCPQYGKPRPGTGGKPAQRTRFHAQRVDMEVGDDAQVDHEVAEGNPYGVDTWGGSRYDSEEERLMPLPTSEGEGSEIIRAQAMAMRVTEPWSDEEDEIVLHMRAGRVTPTPHKPVAHSTSVRRRESTPDTVQPQRDKQLQASLCALINVNGIMAYTLFDSGSTTDSLSPEFSHISRAKPVKLSEQVVLQLGCSGSRSKISYGTWVPIQFGPIAETMYFDIVNLDRYDCVIGTPFMNAHGIKLDFEQRAIIVKGQACPAFTNDEDSAYRVRRMNSRKLSGAIRPASEKTTPELVLGGHLPYVVEEIRKAKPPRDDDRRGPGISPGHEPIATPGPSGRPNDPPIVDHRATVVTSSVETVPPPADEPEETTLPPHQAIFHYPEDSERPRKHSVPWKRDPRLPKDMPDLSDRDPVSLHSSVGVKRDKYGNEDKYGMNELLYEEVVNYLRELPERSYLKPPEVIPFLREQWFQKVEDLVGPIPLELPPMREINHRIPLIDEQHRYNYHHPRCPDAVRGELKAKMDRYLEAGWWEMKPANQAAPLLCVLKKNGKLRTVIDDVARAKYRSKIDMSDAYEQIRIDVEDVWKTAFSTIFGTAISHVMQQGDCNAPGTFQRLMTWIFREYLGVFVHVYLDDIFVFSRSIGEHEEHLRLVFDRLREQRLYLSRAKLDLYSERMDCLGHLIDDRGLHADSDKMTKIRDWPPMQSKDEVLRFLGLVQYLAHFMPDLSAFTSPLEAIGKNGQPFYWRPLHQTCLDRIKDMACKAPILKPIDPDLDEPIWVVTDASVCGIGALYGQGPDWRTCRPAGFMSKKFTSAQRSYPTYEQEALAMIEALLKWEDRLIGRKFRIATDHEALLAMGQVKRDTRSGRLIRWDEFLSRYDYEIEHVPGRENKVADCLSRYFENDPPDVLRPIQDYVNADVRLDPGMEDIVDVRKAEIERTVEEVALRALREVVEDRENEAAELAPMVPPAMSVDEAAVTVNDTLQSGPPLHQIVAGEDGFLTAVREAYAHDATFSKIMSKPEAYPSFEEKAGLLYVTTRFNQKVLCVPAAQLRKRSLRELVIDHAHRTLGHLGAQKTAEYARRWYWWPRMSRDIERFCTTCGACQMSKTSNAMPTGLLHSMPIPAYPWQSVGMDFVGPFPDAGGFNYMLVVICRLTSMVHLIPCRVTDSAATVASYYLNEVVRLHGLPESIVSDRDSKFTSVFWKEVHRLLGTKLLMSTSFHPQTDGASERAIRNVAQILRTVVSPNQSDWVDRAPMVEFAINSSISSSTGFAPFELNYGYMPRMAAWDQGISRFPGVQAFAERARMNLEQAHDAILQSRVNMTYHANRRRTEEVKPYSVGDMVYLSTKNLTLPKNRARKLAPKFIGPYKVIRANPDVSSYTLELPEELTKRRVHPTFHAALLRPHHESDAAIFPGREAQKFYDFGAPDEQEWLVEEITGHRWTARSIEFLVHWSAGEFTWEPLAHCDELRALDDYLALMGVDDWRRLPRLDRRRPTSSRPPP